MCTQWRHAAAKNIVAMNCMGIHLLREKCPTAIGLSSSGAEHVCESTGIFKAREKAELRLKGGAKKVICLR